MQHERWLADHVLAQYGILLPGIQISGYASLQYLPPHQSVAAIGPVATFGPIAAGTQNNVSSSVNLHKPAEQQQEHDSSENAPNSHDTISQPIVDHNGESPRCTSSESTPEPTEEDLKVPYPAPQSYLDLEANLPRGKNLKWTFEEQDIAIAHMFALVSDPTFPQTELRFADTSRHLKAHGIDRTKCSVKNMWNRIGRHRSGLDERKKKSEILATSMQGKQARLENGAKKSRKRKASPETAEPAQKKTKRASQGPTASDTGVAHASPQGQQDLTAASDTDVAHALPQGQLNLTASFEDYNFESSIESIFSAPGGEWALPQCVQPSIETASTAEPTLPIPSNNESDQLAAQSANTQPGGDDKSSEEWAIILGGINDATEVNEIGFPEGQGGGGYVPAWEEAQNEEDNTFSSLPWL